MHHKQRLWKTIWNYFLDSSGIFWFLSPHLSSSSQSGLQQQNRTLIQFQPVFRLAVETLGPKDLLDNDMGYLGALNHLDLEAAGMGQLALLVCLDLLLLLQLDYFYLGAFETFCFLNCFPLSAIWVCCQLNLFQLEAFDFSYSGGFWHFDLFLASASDCFHLGELLVLCRQVLIPLELGTLCQLISVELGSLSYLYSVALGTCHQLVLVKLGTLLFFCSGPLGTVELLN